MSKSNQYPAEVFYSEEDSGYIAVARDLPGCSAFGETAADAISELPSAIDAWIAAAREAGNPIPDPSVRRDEALPSGRTLLRLPRTLHALLNDAADREGVSFNAHVVSLLSACAGASTVARAADVVLASAVLNQRAYSVWNSALTHTCLSGQTTNFIPLRVLESFDIEDRGTDWPAPAPHMLRAVTRHG